MIRAAMLSTCAMQPLLAAVEEADPRQLDWVSAYATVTAPEPEPIAEQSVE